MRTRKAPTVIHSRISDTEQLTEIFFSFGKEFYFLLIVIVIIINYKPLIIQFFSKVEQKMAIGIKNAYSKTIILLYVRKILIFKNLKDIDKLNFKFVLTEA